MMINASPNADAQRPAREMGDPGDHQRRQSAAQESALAAQRMPGHRRDAPEREGGGANDCMMNAQPTSRG